MRPRSLVTPLLLIIAGVVLLYHNLWPETPLLKHLSLYWPFLLVGWGVIRLGEIFYWRSQGRALPPSGISGGEWAIVFLICVLGLGLDVGLRYKDRIPTGQITTRGLEMFGEPFTFPLSAAKTVGKTPRIVLDLGRGNARIVAGDSDQIQVSGQKTIRAFDQTEANRADARTPLEVEFAGDRVLVRLAQERTSDARAISADLLIMAPKGASLEARGRAGDLEVTGLEGSVTLSSDNAGVRLENIGGPVKVDVRRSDIVKAANLKDLLEIRGRGQELDLEAIAGPVTVQAEFTGDVTLRDLAKPIRFENSRATLRAERIAGSVRFANGAVIGENMQGPIILHTRSRDVHLRDFTDSSDVRLERGDIELRPSSRFGKMEARTNNGNVDLVLPTNANFDLVALTERGEVVNDYGDALKLSSGDHGATLKGGVGTGPAIRLNVERGSIVVRRPGEPAVAAKPAVPPASAAPKIPEVPPVQRQ